MRRFLLSFLFISVTVLVKAQNKLYVTQNAMGDGSTWANAAGDLQQTINAAQAGDSIFVQGGVYQPAIGNSFSMKQGVKIYGSFKGTELSLAERHLASGDTSVLLGNERGVIDNPSGLDRSAVLDGFKITGGFANTINNGGHGGGGIHNQNASPTLSHLVITGNTTNYYGGGIENISSSPLLIQVIIKNNVSGNGGGGISIDGGTPELKNSLISGNSSSYGGGIWIISGTATLTGVTVTGNTAKGGGGFYVGGSIIVNNSIIWGNRASNMGNNLIVDKFFTTAMILNYSLYGNGTNDAIDYSSLVQATNHNLTVSPQFVDSAGGNYQLMATSPAVNAGNNGFITADDSLDIAGKARIFNFSGGGIVDMGAYEGRSPEETLPVTVRSFTGNLKAGIAVFQWQAGFETGLSHYIIEKSISGNNFAPLDAITSTGSNSKYNYSIPQQEPAAYYRLKAVDDNGTVTSYRQIIFLAQRESGTKENIQLYPNPAKDHINIKGSAGGTLNIYSSAGQLIKTEVLSPGLNQVQISQLSAGLYFAVINGQKLTFIKQ